MRLVAAPTNVKYSENQRYTIIIPSLIYIAFGFSYLGFYIQLDSSILTFVFRNLLPVVYVVGVVLMEKRELLDLKKNISR